MDTVQHAPLLALIDRLEWWLAAESPMIFVHAAVVHLDGHAVLLPGPSGFGKTTLALALAHVGELYSDEYALIDEVGLVHPYPRHPHLRLDVPAVPLPPLASANSPGLPVSAVVCLRQDRAGLSIQEAATPSLAVALLAAHAHLLDRPAEGLRRLRVATTSARLLSGTRGDASEAAKSLLAWLRNRPPA